MVIHILHDDWVKNSMGSCASWLYVTVKKACRWKARIHPAVMWALEQIMKHIGLLCKKESAGYTVGRHQCVHNQNLCPVILDHTSFFHALFVMFKDLLTCVQALFVRLIHVCLVLALFDGFIHPFPVYVTCLLLCILVQSHRIFMIW